MSYGRSPSPRCPRGHRVLLWCPECGCVINDLNAHAAGHTAVGGFGGQSDIAAPNLATAAEITQSLSNEARPAGETSHFGSVNPPLSSGDSEQPDINIPEGFIEMMLNSPFLGYRDPNPHLHDHRDHFHSAQGDQARDDSQGLEGSQGSDHSQEQEAEDDEASAPQPTNAAAAADSQGTPHGMGARGRRSGVRHAAGRYIYCLKVNSDPKHMGCPECRAKRAKYMRKKRGEREEDPEGGPEGEAV